MSRPARDLATVLNLSASIFSTLLCALALAILLTIAGHAITGTHLEEISASLDLGALDPSDYLIITGFLVWFSLSAATTILIIKDS